MTSPDSLKKRRIAEKPSLSIEWDQADPQSSHFRVDKWPFYNMARLVGLYHLRLDAVLKPIGMDVPRWRVLSILSIYGVVTITKLSDEAVTKISTMAKIIQRMTIQGVVLTQVSTKDARATEVIITEKGRGVLEQVRGKVRMVGANAFHGVSEEDLRHLNEIAVRMHDNLS